ncbi:hypothetical protein KPH14_001750 [Odynerus spinipes]|uniref:Uncharacterized protein n=1 Tax=Odynerus spinipes TaxID=1348599 RepID=A0AAD9VVV0_9HYME|nr:hypothetical protein KPH14_001750 [Odynerus spinipes]
MDKECDLKKKVSHLENIGRKVCLDLRNYQKERIILSREAKCLLREIEKGQSRRRYGKKKHYSKSACTCAIWENSLKTDGRSDENEEDLTSDNGCGCCHNSDQENYCKDSFEICKCSSSKYNTLSEPFENTQPVTIVNDNDDDDDLDDDSDDDSDCINNNDVNQDNIDDTHHELRSNETCTTNPVPLCKMCLFCKANNIHHKFNVNNKSDTGDWIERQRGGGEKTDSESTNDNTPNLSNCICNCDICALRNKHGGRPPCCVQENEQLDHTIDDDYDENLQSSQTVLSEISEIHQYCKITKLREALEKLKNRNHTLRKLLKQRECALPNSMMQQATCNFCSIPGNNCDNNNNVNDCINHRVECKETTRDLVAILKILQSKCRIKDGMIVILADELKDCATNERLKRILDKLTEANIDCGIVDFDRSTLWKYLVSNTKPVHIIKQYCSQRKSIVDEETSKSCTKRLRFVYYRRRNQNYARVRGRWKKIHYCVYRSLFYNNAVLYDSTTEDDFIQ